MRWNLLETRQDTTQLVGGDESFGDGGWQCMTDGCSNPTTTDFLGTCDGVCSHFNLVGGANAQIGAQRTISSSPLVNGGGSFQLSLKVAVSWVSTGSTYLNPTNGNLGTLHFLVNVAGTSVTFPTTAFDSRSESFDWHPYQYSGFLPDSFSSSSATITLGFDANVPTGTGYYSVWVDQFSLTVPKSSSPSQTASITSAGTSAPTSNSGVSSLTSKQSTMSNGTLIANTVSEIRTGSASEGLTTRPPSSSSSSQSLTETNRENVSGNAGVNVGIVGGVVAVVIIALIGISLICWLLKRRRRISTRPREATLVNPYENPEDTYGPGVESSSYQHSPSSAIPTTPAEHWPVEMTEQEQLRQWMPSPTEMLPAYRTSLGSAIPGPVDTSEYSDDTGAPHLRRIGLVLHTAIPEEEIGTGPSREGKGRLEAINTDRKR